MTATDKRAALDPASRRWNWRTWNLLLQIRDAADGNDPRQRSGEMTVRGLSVAAGDVRVRALCRRGWVEAVDCGEVEDERGVMHDWPAWGITDDGREALDAARAEGIAIQ